MTTLAHVAGAPVEELLPALLPAAGVLGLLVSVVLAELGGWRRRR